MRLFSFLLLIITSFAIHSEPVTDKVDYVSTINKVKQLMRQYHYNPDELKQQDYLDMEQKMDALGQSSSDPKTFVDSFNSLWQTGPFSHVRMQQAPQTADQIAAYLDGLNVGEQATSLSITSNTAVMTVNTMMGNDTIQAITNHYNTIINKGIKNLVIDLRNNEGGAFAVKPLVGHLAVKPIDIGVFVSQPWNAKNTKQPGLKQATNQKAWDGWSIRRFWTDVQEQDFIRIQLQPETPVFEGNVYVLLSKRTASAAEMAADALSYLPNVTLVGETTAGQMLSQSIFDVSPGIQMFLPIADYYSHQSGRIEGAGVKPDIEVNADKSLEKAMNLIGTK